MNSWLKGIKRCNADKDNQQWLAGWGYEISALLEAACDPLAALDKISTTRLVTIINSASHSVWIHSKALSL